MSRNPHRRPGLSRPVGRPWLVLGYQNQHIFGWGTENPQPSPGRFDWSLLDRSWEIR